MQVPNAAYRLKQEPAFLRLVRFYEIPGVATLTHPEIVPERPVGSFMSLPLPLHHWLQMLSNVWQNVRMEPQETGWKQLMEVMRAVSPHAGQRSCRMLGCSEAPAVFCCAHSQ